jgi:tetratricopeptide (TPR) repeat protein
MSPGAASEEQARAERFVRRGELAAALEVYDALAKANPADAAIAQRLAQLKENLQPLELQHPKANLREARAPTETPEQEGERLFSIGDYAGAAAAYRRALQLRPDSGLIRERLGEIFELAKQAAPARPAPPAARAPGDLPGMLESLLQRIAERRRAAR